MAAFDTLDLAGRKAKGSIRLLKDSPFFGVLLFKLGWHETTSCPTMATDGERLYYNAAWTSKLTEEEFIGVLAHEVCHVALLHQFRRGDRDPKGWNIAADYAINLVLTDAGFSLPKGGLLNRKYEGWSAEQIYDDLPKSGGGSGGGQPGEEGEGQGGDQPGEVWDHPTAGEGGKAQADAEVEAKTNAADAARVAEQAGKLPGALKRLLSDLLKAKVDWREVLRRFVSQNVPVDFSYRRPVRRHLPDLVVASLHKEGIGPLVFVADTSGSVSDDDLNQVVAEARSIVEELQPEITYLLSCDAEVQATATVYRGEIPESWGVLAQGGGGTSFCPPFEWLTEQQVEPCCLVYVTDGYGYFPTSPPPYPVLWVMTTDVVPPWGEIIPLR